jgi:tetratricopeptide (TPR) repeat protein
VFKIRHIVATPLLLLLFLPLASAETIILKSGKVIEGEIIERNKDYIKVRYGGSEIYYENKYVKNIEPPQPSVSQMDDKKDRETTTASLNKGLELASAGRFDEAKLEFEKLRSDSEGALGIIKSAEGGSITKEFAISLFQGSLYMMDGDYNSARISLEKAWEINPKDPDVNYNLGFVYYALEEYQKASVYLFAALKLCPDDIEAYKLIAKAYYHIGERQKAKDSLLIARELLRKNGNESETERFAELLQTLETETKQEGLR